MNGTFNCQTFKNGIIDIAFDLIKDNQIAENFFKAAGDELTVIDFFNGKEIKPDYDTARAYAECVLNTEEELKQHNETISEYTDRLKSIKQECKVLYSTNPSVSYKKSINLLISCMETAEELFQKNIATTLKAFRLFWLISRAMRVILKCSVPMFML